MCQYQSTMGWTGRTLPAYGQGMRIVIRLLLPMAMLSACATSHDLPADYIGTIKTQTNASDVAACVGQSVAITPVTTVDGLVIDAPGARPPRRYTIKPTKEETVIVMEGGYAPGLAASDAAALKCTLRAR